VNPKALDKKVVVIKQLNASFELEIIEGKQPEQTNYKPRNKSILEEIGNSLNFRFFL
jgi:hypothetical protein